MKDYNKDLFEALGRWPKIGALVGEAKDNKTLHDALVSGDPAKILPELTKRDISLAEMEALVRDVEPYVGCVAEQTWYGMAPEA